MRLPVTVTHALGKDGFPLTTIEFYDVMVFCAGDSFLTRFDPVTGDVWIDFKRADEQ